MLLNGRRLHQEDGPDRILLAIEDVTDRPTRSPAEAASEAVKT
jgi:hypothetical protein